MNNQQAFPSGLRATEVQDRGRYDSTYVAEYESTGGMSLRDYFAAKALQGICASGPGSTWLNADLARESYEIADAMLKAREA